jgi:hypothetical protein
MYARLQTHFAGVVAYVNLLASGSPISSGPLTQGEELIFQNIMLTTPVFARQDYIKEVGVATRGGISRLLRAL